MNEPQERPTAPTVDELEHALDLAIADAVTDERPTSALQWLISQLPGLLAAEAVAKAASAFCAELQEDADGVPQPELVKLHAMLDAYDDALSAGAYDGEKLAARTQPGASHE